TGSHTYATGLGLPDDFGNTFCGGDPPSYHKAIVTTITHEDALKAKATSDAKISLPQASAHKASDGTLIIIGTTGDDSILVNASAVTAKDDGVTDVLTGSSGIDTFYYHFSGAGAKDKVTDKAEIQHNI